MARAYPKEHALLTVLENALEQAVRDQGLDWDYATRTKRQKYGWLAVKHFCRNDDLPITYSWFQYGVSMPMAPASDESWGGTHNYNSLPKTRNPLYGLEIERVVEFYKNGLGPLRLEKNWYKNNFEFLETFYTHHAPEPYRDLYLKNTELRRIFDKSKDRVGKAHIRKPVSEYERVGQITTAMEYELAESDLFDEIVDPILDYSMLLEDAFMMLAKIDPDEFTDKHLSAIISLQSFYKEYTWTLPAWIISRETAVGPNADKVKDWARTGLEASREPYSQELGNVRDACEEAELVPSMHEYPSHNDKTGDVLFGLVSKLNGQ